MTRIAMIGLGNMGGAVARRLAERFEVVGFDQAPGALERSATADVTPAESLAAAARGAEAIITSLPNDAIVRDAWFSEEGVLAHADRGAVGIELSTILPKTIEELAERAEERGVAVVDSPVSGGPGEAETGNLTLLAGGADRDIERVLPILEQLGTIRRTGGVGTGKVVKIVNNMMSMANVVAAAEAFSLGVAAGVDPRRLFEVLSVSGGTSHHFTKRWPKALSDDFAPGFTVALGEKDLALGIELARAAGVPSPVASTGRELYKMAMLQGLAADDVVAMLKFYNSWHHRTET
jgi:3-hydroxyisobutyrate dehydrogenase-like beta-hydroxyacid dehydrogenase